jgi:hypothetical protein
MAKPAPWNADMQLIMAERKLTDALAMYAEAYRLSDGMAQGLSAARMQEMVRGKSVLRGVFSPMVAPKEGT